MDFLCHTKRTQRQSIR